MLTSNFRFMSLFLGIVLLIGVVSLAEDFDDDNDFLQIQGNSRLSGKFILMSNPEKHLITAITTDDVGNIVLSVENTGKRDLTINLIRYFPTKLYNETGAGAAFIFCFSARRDDSNGNNIWMSQDYDIPDRFWDMMPIMRASGDPHTTTPCRHLSLYTGESFSKHERIWELPIWEALVSSVQNNKKDISKIGFSLDIDLSGKEIYSLPEYTVDQITLRRLQNLERAAQRQESKAIPETASDPFRVTLTLSPKTGDLKAAICSSGNLYAKVSVDLDRIFGSKEYPDIFLKRFTAKSQNGILTVLELPSIEETAEYRTLHLEQNETIAKRCKIWDIAVWSEILAASRSDRTRKFELTFPVEVETIDYTPSEYLNHHKETKREKVTTSATLTLDYATVIRMEKLQEASE